MSEGDRSVPAGERRLARAREQGMVPVRRGVVALGGLVGAAATAVLLGSGEAMVAVLRERLSQAGHARALDATGEMAALVADTLGIAWPVMVAGMLGALLATLVQTRGVVVWRRPTADLASRVRAMSSPRAAARALGGLAWVVAAALAGGGALVWQWSLVAALPRLPLAQAVGQGVHAVVVVCACALAALAACAVVDMALARRAWRRSMALTPEDARRDERLHEGDPVWRSQRRRAARVLLRSLRGGENLPGNMAADGAAAPLGGGA